MSYLLVGSDVSRKQVHYYQFPAVTDSTSQTAFHYVWMFKYSVWYTALQRNATGVAWPLHESNDSFDFQRQRVHDLVLLNNFNNLGTTEIISIFETAQYVARNVAQVVRAAYTLVKFTS